MSTKVFISYSHKDERWKDRLLSHLGVLTSSQALRCWDDRQIGVGNDWYGAIEREIQEAQVAVLLISQNFLTSRFILDDEVPRLLALRARAGLKLIPVIVRSCAWQSVEWLASLQARPTDGRPLASRGGDWPDRMLAAIANEVFAMVSVTGHATSRNGPERNAASNVQPALPGDSAKTVAILDRRLVNELLLAFSGSNAGWALMNPVSRSTVLHGLARYNQLLVENIYASTLHQMFLSNPAVPEWVRDAIVVTEPVGGSPVLLELMVDAAELFAEEPRFALALSQYEKTKRGGGFASSDIQYLLHNLLFAASIDSALLPHPQRWPLYKGCFECSANRPGSTFGDTTTPLPTAEQLRERLSQRGPDVRSHEYEPLSAMTLRQIGPCPFPYPAGLLRAYERSELATLPTFQFEFCVPAG